MSKCEHGTYKQCCELCKQLAKISNHFCKHNIRRGGCKECKYIGISICEHNKVEKYCAVCTL